MIGPSRHGPDSLRVMPGQIRIGFRIVWQARPVWTSLTVFKTLDALRKHMWLQTKANTQPSTQYMLHAADHTDRPTLASCLPLIAKVEERAPPKQTSRVSNGKDSAQHRHSHIHRPHLVYRIRISIQYTISTNRWKSWERTGRKAKAGHAL